MTRRGDKKRAARLIADYRRRLEVIRQSDGFDPEETAQEKQARIARCLADPVAFAETYFPHYCTSVSGPFQRRTALAVMKDKGTRRIVRWGRAHAKSVWADIIIPIWLWARKEPMYLVIIGSSFEKAKGLLSDVQAEFEVNPRLITDFGNQQLNGDWTDGRFVTIGGFIGQALGRGQSVRGLRRRAQRPTMIVLDDIETTELCKNPKRLNEVVRWVERDVLGTFDGPIQRLLLANNRFAKDMVQVRLEKKHPDWVVDQVDAYDPVTYEPAWPGKYTAKYWRDLEASSGTLAVHAEYLNRPHEEGSIFTDELFHTGKPPALNHFIKLVGHWDVAYAGTATADYNAVRVWGLDKDLRYWLLGCFVKQSKMRAAVDWMVDFDKRLPPTVVVHWQYESQFWNEELERTINDARDAAGHELRIKKAELVKAHKYDRILSLHGYYQNGRIWFSEKLTGLNDHEVGLDQLKGIEPGYSGHDDAPDADERAITELSREARATRYERPTVVPRPAHKRLW